jgi:hypothetical protein
MLLKVITSAQGVTSFIQQKGRLLHNHNVAGDNLCDDAGGFVFFSCNPTEDRKALEKIQIQQENMESVVKLLQTDGKWVSDQYGETHSYAPQENLKAKLAKLREERRPFLYEDADGINILCTHASTE